MQYIKLTTMMHHSQAAGVRNNVHYRVEFSQYSTKLQLALLHREHMHKQDGYSCLYTCSSILPLQQA